MGMILFRLEWFADFCNTTSTIVAIIPRWRITKMKPSYSVQKSITINAPADRVWESLISPKIIEQYMFGTQVVSTWKKGDTVIYKGQWDGQPFEDRGTILVVEPSKTLQFSFFSASSGLEDRPENYSLITYEIKLKDDSSTTLLVTQDNNPTQEAADLAAASWEMTLKQIKGILEQTPS